MDIELLGGALDGQRFSLSKGDSPSIFLLFSNPVPITFMSNMCAPRIFAKVQYKRSHIKDEVIFYTFKGYAE